MSDFSVKIDGFKSRKQALAFLKWYEGQGEQWFYDYCAETDNDTRNTNIDLSVFDDQGRYWTENGNDIVARVK
jgi:hypothetical protein